MAYIYEEDGILKIAEKRTEEIKDLIMAEFDEEKWFSFFKCLEINNEISIIVNNALLEYYSNIFKRDFKNAYSDLKDRIMQNLRKNLDDYNYKTNYILDKEIKKIFNYCY